MQVEPFRQGDTEQNVRWRSSHKRPVKDGWQRHWPSNPDNGTHLPKDNLRMSTSVRRRCQPLFLHGFFSQNRIRFSQNLPTYPASHRQRPAPFSTKTHVPLFWHGEWLQNVVFRRSCWQNGPVNITGQEHLYLSMETITNTFHRQSKKQTNKSNSPLEQLPPFKHEHIPIFSSQNLPVCRAEQIHIKSTVEDRFEETGEHKPSL